MKWSKVAGVFAVSFLSIGLLSGCGGESKETLNIYTWADNFNSDIIKQFEEEYDVKVNVSVYASNEAMYQKLKASSGQYDIIQPSDYMVETLIKQDMLEKLNKNNIPNLEDVEMKITDTPFDPDGEYSVLYTYGITGIAYNTKYVTEVPTSWADLWSADYSGRVALLDDPREVIGMGLIKNGYSNNSTTQSEIDTAVADLQVLHNSVIAYDTDTIKQKFITEDAWIGTVWSGDAVFIQRDNENVEYVVPEEGATIWADTTAIPKGAKNKELAEKFINFILDPEVSAENFEYIGYINPNINAYKYHSEEYRNNPIIRYVEDNFDSFNLEWLTDVGDYTTVYDEAFTRVKQ